MIGVVSMKGEQTPCNMTHGFQVEAAKEGVVEAGGTPREFTTVSVSDGISMNHEGMKFSLVSRELIADLIEAIVHGLAYDGLVGFGGCDKTLPGVMMGMVRCNVPSVFIYGGAALPGRFGGRDVTILDSYEAVGAVLTGAMDEATLARLERSCLPTVGACAGQFTANTMAMVSEALGLSVPNVSMVPGPYAERAGFARRAGAIVMRAVANGGPRPRDIVTRKALENACAVVAATGGSTNSALHIPAIAHEAGIAFDLDDVAAVFARTPLIADLRPGGRFTARDVHEIGGTAVIIRALIESGAIDGSCLDRNRRDAGADLWRRGAAGRGSGAHGRRADRARRRRRGAEGQSLSRWRADQARRAQDAGARRSRPRVRKRRRLRPCGRGARLQGGRCAGHPQRRARSAVPACRRCSE